MSDIYDVLVRHRVRMGDHEGRTEIAEHLTRWGISAREVECIFRCLALERPNNISSLFVHYCEEGGEDAIRDVLKCAKASLPAEPGASIADDNMRRQELQQRETGDEQEAWRRQDEAAREHYRKKFNEGEIPF